MPRAAMQLLIVDDEPLTRTLLSQVFRNLGYIVRCAEDGFAALNSLREALPDVILSDLNMPGMSGFEFLSVVRRRFPGIYVIAMSAAFSQEGMQPGVAADAFHEKATSMLALVRSVDLGIVAVRQAIREPFSPSPIWIPSKGYDAAGAVCVTISCPDCLRTFSHFLPETKELVSQVSCAHCRFPIQYAIVKLRNAAAPQDFQCKHGLAHLKVATATALQ
jgi:CheY-like chemotaxis protein